MLQGNLSKYIAIIPHISHKPFFFFSKQVNNHFNNCQGTDGKVLVAPQGMHTKKQDLGFFSVALKKNECHKMDSLKGICQPSPTDTQKVKR